MLFGPDPMLPAPPEPFACQAIKDVYNEMVKEVEKLSLASVESNDAPKEPMNTEPDDLEVGDRLGAELSVVHQALNGLEEGDANHWRAVASKVVQQTVMLVPCLQEDTLTQAIKDCSISMAKGGMDGTIIFHFDTKLSGEAISHPNVRVCPLQIKQYQNVVTTILGARSPPNVATPTLQPGEIALLIDGGQQGNKRPLLKPWRPMQHTEDEEDVADDMEGHVAFKSRSILLSKTEASVRARRSSSTTTRAVARGAGSIPQCEGMHICASDLGLPEVSWGHGYEGTNKGTAITGIELDNAENDWTETKKTKRAIYGKHRHDTKEGGDTQAKRPDTWGR